LKQKLKQGTKYLRNWSCEFLVNNPIEVYTFPLIVELQSSSILSPDHHNHLLFPSLIAFSCWNLQPRWIQSPNIRG
jgi:hypothetical protein